MEGFLSWRAGLTYLKLLQDRREGLTFSGLLVRPYESSRPWLHQCCGFHWDGIILHTISSLVLLFEDMWTLYQLWPWILLLLFDLCWQPQLCHTVLQPASVLSSGAVCLMPSAFPQTLVQIVSLLLHLMSFSGTSQPPNSFSPFIYCNSASNVWSDFLILLLSFSSSSLFVISSVFFHCGETSIKWQPTKSFQLLYALGLGTSICSCLWGWQLFLLLM